MIPRPTQHKHPHIDSREAKGPRLPDTSPDDFFRPTLINHITKKLWTLTYGQSQHVKYLSMYLARLCRIENRFGKHIFFNHMEDRHEVFVVPL